MDSKYPSAWVPTGDVKVGDRIVCLLSDADAYPEVTGWSDHEYKTTYTTYRTFTVTGDVPWWVDDSFTSFDLARQALIVTG